MANKESERELGSEKQYEIGEDGSISYFTDEVPDDVREAAESERDRQVAEREEAASRDSEQVSEREVGTPSVVTDSVDGGGEQ